jgi:metal-responsive CopG/Arc/MetJ family transcriptional regulator
MATKTFNLSLPEELVSKIDTLAKSNYMSRSELIKHALIKEIKADQNKWVNLADFTEIDDQGVSAKEIIKALK